MNVCGFMSRTLTPPTTPFAKCESPSLFHPSKCQTSARWSTTHQPTLCRVAAYSRPGLPNPTMAFTREYANDLLLFVFRLDLAYDFRLSRRRLGCNSFRGLLRLLHNAHGQRGIV